jgi:type VI secretion system protein ImpA
VKQFDVSGLPIDKSPPLLANTGSAEGRAMSVIDLNTILIPITPDNPCGADLEYDPLFASAFSELERNSQPKPEQQIGSTIVPAAEPDWKQVQKQALDLLTKSKDLRVGAYLAKALLRTAGWVGFAQGLAALRGFVEHYWDGVYPRLDPSDDNDPTMRVNVLGSISDPPELAAMRAMPLLASRALGRYGLKELEMAAGDAPPPATGEAPTMATIDAAALDCDIATLEETSLAVRNGIDALAGLEAAVAAQVGAASGPNFSKLSAMLRKAQNFLAAKVAERGGGAAAADGAAEGGNGVSAAGGGAATGAPLSGEVRSREDVVRSLDKILAYYAKNEPSSPIPLFMERCKRLVTMSFVDIVRDLVPDALSQVEALKGRAE